jgi:uncharacterized membrane protein
VHEWEKLVTTAANFIQIIFESASALVVATGGVAFVVMLLSDKLQNSEPKARNTLGRYLIVALELQLAADIIATATDPTIEELGKLTVIAVIRTFLDYFLVREIREEKPKE